METGPVLEKILKSHLQRKQMQNPRYSLRAFARHLRISPATLSRILNSKANLSLKSIRILRSRLDLSEAEKKSLDATSHDAYVTIDLGHRLAKPLVEDWAYFAVLSLAETKGFNARPEWIAKRLSIPVSKAAKIIADLLQLGALVKGASGQMESSGVNLTLSGQVTAKRKIHFRKSQIQRLGLAQKSLKALNKENFDASDFSSITLAVDMERLPEAKKRIFKFRRRLAQFLESPADKQEVYVLSLQLFPLSMK